MTIKVYNQKEFETIPTLILNSIESDDNEIIIELMNEGPFYYDDNFISLNNIENNELSFIIKGISSTPYKYTKLISKGHVFTRNKYNELTGIINGQEINIKKYTPESSCLRNTIIVNDNINNEDIYNENFYKSVFKYVKENNISISDEVELNIINKYKYKNENIQLLYWDNMLYKAEAYNNENPIVDTKETIDGKPKYKLYFNNAKEIFGSDTENRYINILRSFNSGIYEILEINDNDIIFKPYKTESYDLNRHFKQVNYQTFRISNIFDYNNNDIIKVHFCTSQNFINIQECKFKEFELSNIYFYGNACNEDDRKKSNLIQIEDSKNINIYNCKFNNIYNIPIFVNTSENININNCKFNNIYKIGIYCETSINPIIYNCNFNNWDLEYSKDHSNPAIRVSSDENIKVYNNTFTGLGTFGINTGTWYGTIVINPNTGEIYNNTFKNVYTYMHDNGLIYLFTQQKGIKVHDNYINGFTSFFSNRGIYCDDGANNYEIYNNIVLNINSTHDDYSIDSRLVIGDTSIRNKNNKMDDLPNINNKIYNNIINGHMKFQGFPIGKLYKGCYIYDKSSDTYTEQDVIIDENNCYCYNNIHLNSNYEDIITDVYTL